METAYESALFLLIRIVRFEEQCAKRRAQRQCIDSRQTDSDSHRQTELAVESTRRTGHEAHRNEHGHHHQRNRNDRAAKLAHRIDRGFLSRFIPLVQLGMDTLDDDDRIVDHNRNSQHHRAEGQQVHTEPDQVKHKEGTDQRHRDGNHRDQCRAEILQEDVHDDHHEQEGLQQRFDHLFDRCEEEIVRTHQHLFLDTGRKRIFDALEVFLDVLDNGRSIRTGGLEDNHRHTRMPIHIITESVSQTAQLNIGDILEPQHFAVGIGSDHDILELLLGLQAPLIAHHILERLVAQLAELAGRSLDILFGQRRRHVGRHQFVLGHHIGLEPDTHRVVGTHHHRIAHTGNTLNLGHDVDVRIVFEELLVVPVVGTVKREDQQHTGLSLLGDDTDLRYLGRQETLRLGHTVLHVDGRHVGVDTLLEVDGDRRITGIGGGGGHVIHVLHTVDLLLQRSDHAVQHSLGVRTGIGGIHPDRRGGDIGILLHRQRHQPQQAQDDDEDRNHRRQHRAVDKSI